ncbi:hypothetical protein BMS3Bbin01_01113 [bacterium BMS3Bbin01]|nr:hypothetical protein BMS3Bbin01_01113 [bacterium BMS3Bbin01]
MPDDPQLLTRVLLVVTPIVDGQARIKDQIGDPKRLQTVDAGGKPFGHLSRLVLDELEVADRDGVLAFYIRDDCRHRGRPNNLNHGFVPHAPRVIDDRRAGLDGPAGDLGLPSVHGNDESVGREKIECRQKAFELLFRQQFLIVEVRGLASQIDDRRTLVPVPAGHRQRLLRRVGHRLAVVGLG